jgi:hypothetical protein
MQPLIYHVQPCFHQLLRWPSLDHCLFEVYLTLPLLGSPCASHALLAIK